AGSRRVAYYTNLPPGNYNFRVSAGVPGEPWSEALEPLALRLLPHFYQTWYFYSALLLALALALFGLYRLRVSQIQARFNAVMEERIRISHELHDSVSQSLAGLSLQLRAVLENPASLPLSK